MTSALRKGMLLTTLGILITAPSWGDDFQIAIAGNSAVYAQPGDTTGFGISVYSPDEYALFTGSQFLPSTSLGTYTDFLSSSFFFGTAGATVLDEFDALNQTGAGSFTVDPAAPLGASVTGTLEVFYDAYSVSPDDPNFDPIADEVSFGNFDDLAVSITVGDTPTPLPPLSQAPEPFSLGLMAFVAAASFWLSRKRRRQVTPLILMLAAAGVGFQAKAQNTPVSTTSAEQNALNIIRTSEFGVTANCHPDSDPTSTVSCCGAPGNHGCVTYSTSNLSSGGFCTNPSSNKLRTDMDGSVICNLPAAACDPAIPTLINTPIQGSPDQTFYMTSDIHFFRPGWTPENNIHHVAEVYQVAPANIGWPGTTGTIGAPQAIVIAGDLGLDATSGNLGAYRLLWERSTIDASIQTPVFWGLGNHDTVTQADATGARRMYQYLTSAMNCGVSMDTDGNGNGSGNYSWNWQGLHLIMLNTWAGDQNSLYVHTSDGLTWLQNDLANKVGNSGRPVVIFQHYDFSSADGNWWTSQNVSDFLAKIANYNVIAFYAGHTHVPAIDRLDSVPTVPTVLKDTVGNEKVLDEFTNGTGGLNGQGDFIATRYHQSVIGTHTDSYLDLASVSWNDSTNTPFLNYPAVPHNYYGGLAGCHKRVNVRFNDIHTLAPVVIGPSGNSRSVTITPASGNPVLPYPLAVQFPNVPSDDLMVTANFVDSCGIKGGESYSSIPNSHYVQLDDSQVDQLNQGLPVTMTVEFANDPGELKPILVAISPLTGAVPFSIDVITAAAQIPPVQLQDPGPQTFTAYSIPQANYTLNIRYINSGSGWLSLTVPTSGQFDPFGRVVVTLSVDVNKLSLVNSVQPLAYVDVTSDKDPFTTIASVGITIQIKAAVQMTVTANPASSYDPTSAAPAIFTATVTHPTVPEPANGGTWFPTGTMTLSEATLNAAGVVISTTPVSFTNDINNSTSCDEEFEDQGIDAGQSLPPDTAVFGSLGNWNGVSGYCPSHDSKSPASPFHTANLSLGLHHFVVQYSGDANFVPATSPEFDYLVARPLVSMRTTTGSGQTALIGTTFAQPLTVTVIDNSGQPAPGIPVTFSAPATGASGVFPGGVPSVTVPTGANGAVSPPFAANLTPGSYQVSASAGGLTPAQFNLVNTPTSGTPVLTATVTAKSGPATARIWDFHVTNTGNFAAGVQLTQVSFTQVAGAACTPVIQTALPLSLGDLNTNGAVTAPDMTIGFGSCPAAARFTVNVTVTANGAAYSRIVTIGNQFQ